MRSVVTVTTDIWSSLRQSVHPAYMERLIHVKKKALLSCSTVSMENGKPKKGVTKEYRQWGNGKTVLITR